MRRLHAIAINTFREAVRDRVLYGVLALASAVLIFTLALAELSLDQQQRVVEDIGLASISLFAVLVAVFLGSSLLYKEIERKTLYVIVPKPIHRWELLVGKYVGITLTASVFVMLMGAVQLAVMGVQAGGSLLELGLLALALAVVLAIVLWRARDRTSASMPWSALTLIAMALYATRAEVDVEPVLCALCLNVAEVSVLTATALFFSSFSTPFLTGGFTVGIWLVGRSADSMQTMRSRLLGDDIKAILRGLAEAVPNFNLFVPGRAKLLAPDAWTYVGTSAAYAVVYTAILLLLAALIFRKRDFL